MPNVEQLKAPFCLEILVVFDIGRHVHVGACAGGIPHQKRPASAAHRNALHVGLHGGGVLQGLSAQRLFDVVGKILPSHGFWQLPHHACPQIHAAVFQSHAVVGHLLVRMGLEHGAAHGRHSFSRNDHFQTDFGFAVNFAGVPDKGGCTFEGAERTCAFGREAALVVVADVPCSRLGHGIPNGIGVVCRNENRPLFEFGPHRTQDAQRLGCATQKLPQVTVHAGHDVVEVGVDGVEGNAAAHRTHDRALHVVAAVQPLESAKNDRVVAHDELASLPLGFGDHVFRAVEADQHLVNLHVCAAHQQSHIVVRLGQMPRRPRFEPSRDVPYLQGVLHGPEGTRSTPVSRRRF